MRVSLSRALAGTRRFQPWRERGGPVAPLKLAVFVALFVPGLWIGAAYFLGELGARPLTEAIREIGLWTLRWLFITLAITPLRQILQWPRLIRIRRILGVAVFAYAVAHLSLYAADEAFDLVTVASEIVRRIYLTIGFIALLGVAALAATSTDATLRRLGGRGWRRLHALVYPIALLGCIHFFLQAKLDVWEPTVMFGWLAWLFGYRLLARATGARGRMPILWVGGLGLAAALATALGEAVYFHFAFGADPWRVLAVNVSLATGLRPAVVVLASGLVAAAAGALPPLSGRATRLRPYAPPIC